MHAAGYAIGMLMLLISTLCGDPRDLFQAKWP